MTAIATQVFEDAGELARNVAEEFIGIVNASIEKNGRCVVALAGGSTPKRLYQILATDEYMDRIDWRSVHLFISDERHVPLDHEESNFGMAMETLVRHVPVPDDQVHTVPTHLEPWEAAKRYEDTIRQVFDAGDHDVPSFDLILLGIGGDGHTASLFPGTDALGVDDRLVVENWVPQQESMRISFTIPLLLAAREILLMATGQDKADAVRRTIEGERNVQETPCQILRDAAGDVTFALDNDAACELSRV